jgi:hypothetical protein
MVANAQAGPGLDAVEWSLEERGQLPAGKPPAARIAEYFVPAVRDGPKGRFKLNMMEGNWCAAGASFAAMQAVGTEDLESAGIPHAYRVSGQELEDDAVKHGAWLPVAAVLEGARPNVGDLAIYNRGSAQDWTRHVGRVAEVRADGYTSIDANGVGAAWSVTEKLWTQASLRGFIRYPVSAGMGVGKLAVLATLAGLAVYGFWVWRRR